MAKEQELPWRQERRPSGPPGPPAPPGPPSGPQAWGEWTHNDIYALIRDSFDTVWRRLEELDKLIRSSSSK